MLKYPSCPKCSGYFVAKESGHLHKRPLVLNCGHTFCESCLINLAREKNKGITCPTCMGETELESGESSVKLLCPDRYIMGTVVHNQKALLEKELQTLKKVSQTVGHRLRTSSGCSDNSKLFSEVDSGKLCKECAKRQATSHCLKCECNMCTVCFQRVHSLSRSLQLHTSVPLTEDGQLEKSHMCKEHQNRPIEYYCDDDDVVICSRCVIVGNHKGHTICSLEDKNRSITNEMEPNLQVANHVFRRLKKIDKELPLLLPDYTKVMTPVLDEIRSHFQRLHGILQVREQVLEQEVIKAVRGGMEPIEKLKTDLHNEFKQLDSTIKSAHRIMNNSDEIIVNAKDFLNKLAHAKDIPCLIEPLNSTEIVADRIRFIEDPSVDTLLTEYGSITGTIPQSFRIFTLRDKPEKFMENTESDVLTPVESDCQSVTSDTTSQGEDVIIEEEQEIVLNGAGTKTVESVNVMKPTVNEVKSVRKSLPKKKFSGQNNEKVLVTHIQSPCKFMVQLKKDSSKVAELSHRIQQFCNSPAAKHHMVTGVDVDDIVLAQYSIDKKWYRGRIKYVIEPADNNFDNTNVEICYIDYGNSEVLNVKSLRNMQAKFMRNPEFSIECCLFNIASKVKDGTWSVEAVKTFAQMVDNKVMLLSIIREENNVMLVDLSKPADEDIIDDRPMSVRDALVFLGLASIESPYSLPEPGGAPAPKRNFLTPSPKEEGQTYPVIVTYPGTPDCFYIQELGEEIDYLATMMAHIQDTYTKQMKDTWQIICPAVGMICVSRFSGDGLWYRAKIVDLPGHQDIVVQYVDYGNKEKVNILNLRKIIDSFLVLPAQAIKCTLTDVEPLNADEGWTRECLDYWSSQVLMKKFYMKVISSDHQGLGIVLRDIDTDDTCDTLNTKVVEEGIARSVGKWSEPQVMTEVANEMKDVVPRLSYQKGSGMFPEPCDLGHQPVYWKSRNSKPTRRYEEVILTPPNSPERQAQSRQNPQICPVPSRPKPEVQPEKFTVAKALLQNTQSNKNTPLERSQRSPSKLSPSPSRDLRPQTPQDSVSEMSSVSSAANLTEKSMNSLGTKPKTKSGHEKKTKKLEIEVKVSHFVSPYDFYLQLASDKEELERLMSSIDETYKDSEMAMTNWRTGNYCVAFLPSACRWFRGKITKVVLKSLMEVHMLDYGFSELVSCSNLRQVLKQYRKNRAFAFGCRLAGLTPAGGMKDWSKTACEFMEDNITNKKLFLNQRGKPKDGKLPCDLIIEEYVDETALEPGRKTYHSLINRLKEKGLAIPERNKCEEVHGEKVFPVCYYKKAEAEVKTGDNVMPVYIDYDAVIHCYTMEGDDIFQNMCDVLHQKFSNSAPHGPEQTYVKGQACAAYFEQDGQWHRATILEIHPTRAKIHYIDYGNTEWVGYENLRADIEEFTDIPQQTFLCTLHNVRPMTEDGKWDQSVVEQIHKDLVNKYCKITVMDKNGYESEHMTVNLEVNGIDYSSHLVHYGIAQRGDYITDQEMQSAEIELVLKKKNPFKVMPSPDVGEFFPVMVTHVELPNIVYIQPRKVTEDVEEAQKERIRETNRQLEDLEKLSVDLNHAAPHLPAIPVPQIVTGLACCAQFDYDQCWYRAVIIRVYKEAELILVLFVDYGNAEIITYNKLCTIPPSFLTLPCQASRCTLSRLKPASNLVSWTKNCLNEMISVVGNKSLLAKVLNVDRMIVELYERSEEQGYVYQPVIDAGYIQLDTSSEDSPVTSPAVREVVTVRKTVVVPEVAVEAEPENIVKPSPDLVPVKQDTESVNTALDRSDEVSKESVSDVTIDRGVNVVDVKITQVTVDSTTDDDRSEASYESIASASNKTGEKVSKSSKSWAEMYEEGSSVDVDEVLIFDDADLNKNSIVSDKEQGKPDKDQDKKSTEGKEKDREDRRDSRKVESVQYEECFD